MSNESQNRLLSLLSAPPEEVLAIVQSDLRSLLHSIEASVEILSQEEFSEDLKSVVERLDMKTKTLRQALDLILEYLSKRREINESSGSTLTDS